VATNIINQHGYLIPGHPIHIDRMKKKEEKNIFTGSIIRKNIKIT